jgi:hypothetical protein
MKFYLTYEYLLDRIVEGIATKKEIKLFKKWCKKDRKKLNPTTLL